MKKGKDNERRFIRDPGADGRREGEDLFCLFACIVLYLSIAIMRTTSKIRRVFGPGRDRAKRV
jgi:hypothetical protein